MLVDKENEFFLQVIFALPKPGFLWQKYLGEPAITLPTFPIAPTHRVNLVILSTYPITVGMIKIK